jgi:hypothetical protein
MYIYEISIKRWIFGNLIKSKKFHLLKKSMCTYYELKSPKIQATTQSFYNQFLKLDFHRPFKILLLTSGRQNRWSLRLKHDYRYCLRVRLLLVGNCTEISAKIPKANISGAKLPFFFAVLSLMTFWCGSGSGSGSADPCLWLMDPDPAISVTDLQDANKKLIFYYIFSAYYFLKVHLHLFS